VVMRENQRRRNGERGTADNDEPTQEQSNTEGEEK